MVMLVSTLHDPDGRMVEASRRHIGRILDVYDGVAVVPTMGTSPRLLGVLAEAIVEPLDESNGAIGIGRRHALKLGLRSASSHLHYCDFDRLLHWIDRYPSELAAIVQEIQRYDYLITGRTERAFATHPRVQIDTESITNRAFSLWYGKDVDVTAGSCGLSRRAADLILERSASRSNATDTEWPALVHAAAMDIGFARTDGLEFETPDYFQDQIAEASSLDAWVEERSRPVEAWISRTRLTLESLEALRSAGE
jgi:hypothetical protein